MRSLTLLVTAALAAFSVNAASICQSEMCGSKSVSSKRYSTPSSTNDHQDGHLTNAERFRMHMGPAPPKKRGTPTRRADPSPVPSFTTQGVIQVTNTDTNLVIGYISRNSVNNMAQYGYTADPEDALIVSVSLPVGTTQGSMVNFAVENSDITAFPYAGLVQGRDSTTSDIAPGSFNYGYISSTNPTPPGSTPQLVGNPYPGPPRTSESAIWTVNIATGDLSVQWINTDGSLPTTFLFTQNTGIYFGGDPTQFFARYPAPILNIKLTFVPL